MSKRTDSRARHETGFRFLRPGASAIANLNKMNVKGEVVDSRGNTVVDSLRIVSQRTTHQSGSPYVLATFHRLETLTSAKRLQTLILAAQTHQVTSVMQKPTAIILHRRGLLDRLDDNVEHVPALPRLRRSDQTCSICLCRWRHYSGTACRSRIAAADSTNSFRTI